MDSKTFKKIIIFMKLQNFIRDILFNRKRIWKLGGIKKFDII